MAIEQRLEMSPYDFAQQLEQRGKNAYRKLPMRIPLLFTGAWILLLLVGAVRFIWHVCH